MTTTGPAALRVVRAAVFGTAVLVLAVAAHVLAGGSLPSFPFLVAIGVPVACAAALLARRTRGLPVLLASLGATQLALHEVFVSTGGAVTSCGPVIGGTAGAGRLGHHASTAVGCVAEPVAAHAHAATSAPMLLLHLVATTLTALLLAHGERLAVRLAVWARGLVVLAPVAALPVLERVARIVRTVRPITTLRPATDVSRRGPPVRPAFVPVFTA